MKRLVLTIVPPQAPELADKMLAEFRRVQSALVGAEVEVTNIRGEDANGGVVAKRSYKITISEAEAPLFRATEDPTPIEVIVVPLGPADATEHEFAEWWERHELLRAQLGDDGYRVDVTNVAGPQWKQYRIFISASQAPLLAS